LGQLGKIAGHGKRAACVKRELEWRDVVGTAKAMGMYRTKVLSLAVGRGFSVWSGIPYGRVSLGSW